MEKNPMIVCWWKKRGHLPLFHNKVCTTRFAEWSQMVYKTDPSLHLMGSPASCNLLYTFELLHLYCCRFRTICCVGFSLHTSTYACV
jgi:hypothetical protein